MGLFCANVHFRTNDDAPLRAALKRRRIDDCHTLDAKGGWISLYEERMSEQNDEWIRDLAGGLSKDLQVPAIAFLVHDSDIACYWLYDKGQLQDEYNSCPDYFEDSPSADGSPSGGQTHVLVRYCPSGTTPEQLAEILGKKELFAEGIIEQLAKAMGIDRGRAIADYRSIEQGEGPDDEGGDDDDGGGPSDAPSHLAKMGPLAKMLGFAGRAQSADPGASALVQAAAKGDLSAIDRLVSEGIAVDAEAPAPLPAGPTAAAPGQFLPAAAMALPMSPLLAAIVNKQRGAAERLLERGANPNHVHPIFGTAVHAAIGTGEVELLQLLIDRGGDVNARNLRGQTPLQTIAAGRATKERLAQAQAMMKSMGMEMPGIVGQLSQVKLPLEGWDACERLLKAKGAR
jgi:hypothetical protein